LFCLPRAMAATVLKVQVDRVQGLPKGKYVTE